MKKFFTILGIGTVLLVAIIYTIQKDEKMWKEARKLQDANWESFAQKKEGALKARPLSVAEKKSRALPHVKKMKQKRGPASTAPSNIPEYDGHKMYGLPQGSDPEDVPFKNTPSPYWKKKLARRLLRFQQEGTEVLIRKEERVIYITEGKAEWVEKVAIAYKRPDGLQTSYRALVDSESGKVYKTWDRSILEDYKKQFKRRPFEIYVDSF